MAIGAIASSFQVVLSLLLWLSIVIVIKLTHSHFSPGGIGISSIYMERGDKFYRARQYQNALLRYDQAIAIRPQNYLAWKNRGDSLRLLKRYQEAITSYDKAIELKSDNALAWGGRAWALERLVQRGGSFWTSFSCPHPPAPSPIKGEGEPDRSPSPSLGEGLG